MNKTQKNLPPNYPNVEGPDGNTKTIELDDLKEISSNNYVVTNDGKVFRQLEDGTLAKTRFFKDSKGKLKLKPMVHIDKHDGFDELLSSLDILTYLNSSDFTHPQIDNSNFSEYKSDLDKIYTFAKEKELTTPVFVKGLTQNKARLNRYKSDTYQEFGVKYSDSKSEYEKYDEQRIRNAGKLKIMDNFRYTILRSRNLASENLFPFGMRLDDGEPSLAQYDRSNMSEFEIVNFLPWMNKKQLNMTNEDIQKIDNEFEVDTIGKKDLILVIENIKDEFDKSYPEELDEFLDSIKSDSVSTEYKIQDVIQPAGIKALLNKFNLTTVLIGYHDVISKELENLNNKNTPWVNINYVFQKIKQMTDVSFVNEAKRALLNDGFIECREYFDKLIENAPEYCLLPVIAYDIFNKTDFKLTNDECKGNYERLAYMMEGKHIEFLSKKYKSINEIPTFRYELINAFYSQEALDVWKTYKKKLKNLKKVLAKLRKSKSKSKVNTEILSIAMSKIDALTSDSFGYSPLVTLMLLFASNGKTIKNDDENVVKAVDLFLKEYFGENVFTVDTKTNEYCIMDDEFLNLLKDTDSDGYANSHSGRSNYFVSDKLQKYLEAYQNYEDYQGTNEERVDNVITELKTITKSTKFGWWEDTTGGKTVYCGYDDDKKDNVSWEHIINSKQTHGAIRANETNSGDGAKFKAYDTTSGYYEYILKQQDAPKVKKAWKDDDERAMCKLQLKKIVKHYKHEEMKAGLGL